MNVHLKRRIFVDSDVVISALLFGTGAASLLLREKTLSCLISSVSLTEIIAVSQRLAISKAKLSQLIKENLIQVKLTDSVSALKKKYKMYVVHAEDAHIVAGAIAAQSQFLVTYNLKHYRRDNLKADFEILVMSPGIFLQYLRSQQVRTP